MVQTPVYMDNHATTRVDPRVVEAMLPFFGECYGNPGSTGHVFGWEAQEAVDQARRSLAGLIGASEREVIFTSGATESTNLAIRGVMDRNRRKGNHVISVSTEHRAVLDPLQRLGRRDGQVTLLKPAQVDSDCAGWLDPQQVADAICPETALVSVMLANNEIGVLQPLAEIGEICRENKVLFHTDATQALGRVTVDVEALGVDLLSGSAHKFYGPKGCGLLYVRRRPRLTRLDALIEGGGQEHGLRSGTLNPAGIVGMGKALELACDELPGETLRLGVLRDRLFAGFQADLPDVTLNGPPLANQQQRLSHNLNCSFEGVDGEALLMSMKELAVSSGSACTSADPEPSHVLRAIGVSDDLTRASLRFGLGRFTTEEEVEFGIKAVCQAVQRLRGMKSV
ncbi:MAG: aminotransferase class V-fold PLP-dependent enzyme [Planctomycetaceae bacterium]|nr:aminotransferase class V-fold PLP-dependent enzyme [Planctomycetaceae bacterium]